MSDELKCHPTTIRVTRTVKRSGKEETNEGEPETIEVHRFATNPAVVSVSYPIKLTRAYQAAGIQVGVSLPCYAEEVEQAFERANDLVIARLKVEVPKLKQFLARIVEEAK